VRFYDRVKEREFFEKIKTTKKKQMIVIFGRRRIGKTTLLRKVLPDAAYFFVDTRSSETLLADFSRQVFNGLFENWESFFCYLFKNYETVIFDEFQNFLRVDRSGFSSLQKVWDELDSKTMLILCGSYVGMMKRIFFDSKEPLFGRSDYKLQLKPFDFISAAEMLLNFGYPIDEVITWYSILGGVPKYLWYLDKRRPFKELLYELFFAEFAPFREEGKNLLVGEFGSEHPGYFAVLEAIGDLDREAKEITDRTNMNRTKVMKYMNELVNYYDIIEKVDNRLSKAQRGARYRIKDNFLSFWFRYIYAQQAVVEFNPQAAFEYTLENQPASTGRAFEKIISSLIPLFYNEGIIPVMPHKVGKHWGKVPGAKDKSYEIDLVGEDKASILVFECKWTNKPVTRKTANDFLKKCDYIKDSRKRIPVMISKSGFVGNIDEKIVKIDLDTIERLVKKHIGVR